MEPILKITNEALEQIKKVIKSAPFNTDGILIGVDKGGCSGYSYKLDFAKQNTVDKFDFVINDGVKVYIDPKAIIYLIGSEMDYVVDKLSSRFIFNNPNEKNTCGCGESFSI